jgi:hypothetical protein
VLHHPILLSSDSEMMEVVRAVGKIHEHVRRLR